MSWRSGGGRGLLQRSIRLALGREPRHQRGAPVDDRIGVAPDDAAFVGQRVVIAGFLEALDGLVEHHEAMGKALGLKQDGFGDGERGGFHGGRAALLFFDELLQILAIAILRQRLVQSQSLFDADLAQMTGLWIGAESCVQCSSTMVR